LPSPTASRSLSRFVLGAGSATRLLPIDWLEAFGFTVPGRMDHRAEPDRALPDRPQDLRELAPLDLRQRRLHRALRLQGLLLTAVLYGIFAALSVAGLVNWRRLLDRRIAAEVEAQPT
jgi:hypothetical protein